MKKSVESNLDWVLKIGALYHACTASEPTKDLEKI